MGKYKDKINTNNEKIEQLTDVVRNKRGGYSVTQNIDGDNCTLYIKDSGATNPLSGLIDGDATEITIPYGMTSIAGYAFAYMGKLKKINIPDTVKLMGGVFIKPTVAQNLGHCFYFCGGLEELDLSSITYFGSSEALCGSCTALKKVTFNDALENTSLDDKIFSNCQRLEEISIPSKITKLSKEAFYSCLSLKELKGGWKNVTQLGEGTFQGCRSLDMPELPEGFTILGGYSFQTCTSLKWKYLPSTVNEILYYSFQGCTSLTEMTFKGDITTVRTNAFYGCTNLTKFSFPNNTAVPTLQTVYALPNGANFTGTIEVPSALLDTWKSATNWSSLTQATWVGI